MAVYVDYARIPFRGMLMCHMFADSREELHAMADRIGLRREWFQKGASLEHYDVSLTKRLLAIKCGAVAVDRAWLKERIRAKIREMERRAVEKGDIARHRAIPAEGEALQATISTPPGTSAPPLEPLARHRAIGRRSG